MAIEIRAASETDAVLIAELNTDVQALHATALPWLFKPPSIKSEEFSSALGDPDCFAFVAFVDEFPAGYVLAELFTKSESTIQNAHQMIYVHHLSVRPEYRRQGVGRALLDAAKQQGKELNVELFALDVWRFNDEARDFFHKYGLETFNEKMWMKI